MQTHSGLEPEHVRNVALPAARIGKSVIVIPVTESASDHLFRSLDPADLDTASRVVRTHGDQSVHFDNGGHLRFISAGRARRGGARGYSADLIVIDGAALPDERLETDLVPALRPSGAFVVAQHSLAPTGGTTPSPA